MRILLYAPNYLPATRYGGPIRSSHGLAKALTSLGHEVVIYTSNLDGPALLDVPLNTPVDIDGVQVHYFDIRYPRRLYRSPIMARALQSEMERFDVVHVNGMFLLPGSQAARAARKAGTPYVVSPRGMLVADLIAAKSTLAKRAWIGFFERRTLAEASAIHVTSEIEAEEIRRLRLDVAPLVLIPNGVNAPCPPPSRDAREEQWRGAPRGGRVAFLARLDWNKGVDLAVDAALSLPNVFLRIAGPDQDGLRPRLEQRIAEAGASNRIAFTGPLDGSSKWAFLAGADVMVVPSMNESFSIAAAEALAVGVPVVCTEGVGASDIIRRIDPTCIVARNHQALANALSALLTDQTRQRAYSAKAVALMRKHYSWATVADRMVALYRDARSREVVCRLSKP